MTVTEGAEPAWVYEQYADLVRRRESFLYAQEDDEESMYADTEDEGEEYYYDKDLVAAEDSDDEDPQAASQNVNTPPQLQPRIDRPTLTALSQHASKATEEEEPTTSKQAPTRAEPADERAEELPPGKGGVEPNEWAERFQKVMHDLAAVELGQHEKKRDL